MQLTKVRIGRFYMYEVPKSYPPEKVLAYGVLRESGKLPLVTVKDYAGNLFHVPARRLSPIERTPEQDMATLVTFVDGFQSVPHTNPEHLAVALNSLRDAAPEPAGEIALRAARARVYAEAMARS